MSTSSSRASSISIVRPQSLCSSLQAIPPSPWSPASARRNAPARRQLVSASTLFLPQPSVRTPTLLSCDVSLRADETSACDVRPLWHDLPVNAVAIEPMSLLLCTCLSSLRAAFICRARYPRAITVCHWHTRRGHTRVAHTPLIYSLTACTSRELSLSTDVMLPKFLTFLVH